MNHVDLSVVLPVYNEEQNFPELYRRLTDVLRSTKLNYEIIFVDDGSRDASRALIHQTTTTDPRVRALFFSRNFGHQAAIAAGIDHAAGNAVVAMDADLQDPPEFIPELVAKWREGFQVVYAVRKNRKESLPKRMAYQSFYRLLRKLSNVDIPLDTGDFGLMDRAVVNLLKRMPERNRFIRGLRSWTGFKQIGLEYDRQERFAGDPKYTFKKLFKLAIDGFLSFSYVPLRIALWVGMGSVLFSISFIGYALYSKFIMNNPPPPGWTSLAIAVTMLGGLQLVLIGFIGEYIGRIYDEVRQRPYYIVADALNFAGSDLRNASIINPPQAASVPQQSGPNR